MESAFANRLDAAAHQEPWNRAVSTSLAVNVPYCSRAAETQGSPPSTLFYTARRVWMMVRTAAMAEMFFS